MSFSKSFKLLLDALINKTILVKITVLEENQLTDKKTDFSVKKTKYAPRKDIVPPPYQYVSEGYNPNGTNPK